MSLYSYVDFSLEMYDLQANLPYLGSQRASCVPSRFGSVLSITVRKDFPSRARC